MKELIILIIICGLTFLFFLVALIVAIRRKSKRLAIASVFLFVCFGCVAVCTGIKLAHKSYHTVKDMLHSRTGDEIYDALFGKPQVNCVQVLDYQDQVIPKMDDAIWLHCKTCPAEMTRVLARHKFSMEKLLTANTDQSIPLGENIHWFNPNKLGDTILVFEYTSEDGRNIQTIWSTTDSTEMYCRDIF